VGGAHPTDYEPLASQRLTPARPAQGATRAIRRGQPLRLGSHASDPEEGLPVPHLAPAQRESPATNLEKVPGPVPTIAM